MLAIVAALVILDEAAVQPALLQLTSFAPAINLAGRQRMLSQRLTKAALALRVATSDADRQLRRSELGATIVQWKMADALLNGSSSTGSQSSEVTAAWTELAPHFRAMCIAGDQMLRATATSEINASQEDATINRLLIHESRYLPIMERIVKLLEDSSQHQISHLRGEAMLISAAVIAQLVCLGWFVVLPATRTIRAQVDGLEVRVADRTRELSDTNLALEREIVDHQEAELEKQRLSMQLAHASRISSIGHLATGLAHEINQPLTAIANLSEACELLLCQEAPAKTKIAALFEQIKSAALRAGKIVRRVRNFARPIGGVAVATSLRALIREVAELCRFELEQADVRLSLELAPGDDLVLVDGIQIQQVLVNLIENSVHALKSTLHERRAITISTRLLEGVARIDVSDTGPGFGGRDPDSIFAPYFTTKEDGLGIGLSLCRSIVTRHGGEIWAESRPDGSARLSFTLPRVSNNDDVCRESTDCICSG